MTPIFSFSLYLHRLCGTHVVYIEAVDTLVNVPVGTQPAQCKSDGKVCVSKAKSNHLKAVVTRNISEV